MAVLQNLDILLFHLINHASSSIIFDYTMPVVSEAGGDLFLITVSLVFLLSKRKEARMTGILILAGLAVSSIAVSAMKNFFAHPRPAAVLCDAIVRTRAYGFSFPSAHTTKAFMMATVVRFSLGRGAVLYALAIAVGVARVYLGAHVPSDILAGMVTGTLIGYLLVRLAPRP